MDNIRNGLIRIFLPITIFIISVYLILIPLNIPYIGLTIEENAFGEWQVSKVDDIGWAHGKGIKVGDIVKLVNQIKPSNYSTVLQYSVIEQAKEIVTDRNGQEIIYNITNDLTSGQIVYHIFIPVFVFILSLIFSCFLYIKRREDKSALILILFFLTVGLSYLSAGASSRIDFLAIYINRICLSLVPIFFLEFLNNYLKQYGVYLINRKLLFALYCINSLLLIIGSFFLIFGLRLSIIRYSFLVVFLIGIILSLYILISRYIRFRKTKHKPVLKIMLVGVTLAFCPFVFLVGLPSIIFGTEFIPAPVAAAFLVFLPVTFIYLVTANRLFDVDFIINRIRYYSIIALFPTSVFILVLIYLLDKEITIIQKFQITLLTYIGIIAFLYLKEDLDSRFRSKLFREKYNFQASLNRFSHDIARVMKISELEERLIMEAKEVLAVKSISILEFDKNDCIFRVMKGVTDVPAKLIIEWIKEHPLVIPVGEMNVIDNGICLVVGKKMNKSYLLWIGNKLNRTYFNQDEKVWLKTIARYAGLVYENLHLIEGLMEELEETIEQKKSVPTWILRLIFNLSEKERRRLASDLHDSALQDQLLWYRNLDLISMDKRIPVDLKEQLDNVAEGLLDVIHQIRETCNELRPPLLKETGIVKALENLFANVQLRYNYVVNFETDFDADLDYEHILALYRIVQELLTNASKHSKATIVEIILKSKNDTLILKYQDNGVGMELKNLNPSFAHMGLSGIKERVSSLEGEVSFYSSPGNGFQVLICIPMNIKMGVYGQS
jgi:two-component system sensor histidine kinase ComP